MAVRGEHPVAGDTNRQTRTADPFAEQGKLKSTPQGARPLRDEPRFNGQHQKA